MTRQRPRRDTKIPRAQSTAVERITRADLRVGAYAVRGVDTSGRPRTRGECVDGPRPCPWAGCKYHLALDVNPETGTIKINRPDLEVWELEHSCALDIADVGGLTLEATGLIANLTRERIRQLEIIGLVKLRAVLTREDLATMTIEGVHHLDSFADAPYVDEVSE